MSEAGTTTEIDALWAMVRTGDKPSFGDWMGRVERPIRASVRRFASVVDLEVVVQETFLRMWVAAREGRELEGMNASLRFALGMARRVALEELRRARVDRVVPLDDADPESFVTHDPPPTDHGLRAAIERCIEKLPRRPKEAIQARLDHGHDRDDGVLAQQLRSTRNTFLQNVVRARRLIGQCLKRAGVALEDLA